MNKIDGVKTDNQEKYDTDLIRSSFDSLKPYANEFAAHFYQTLFRNHPEALGLFKKVDMEKQKQALIHSLVYCVDHLDKKNKIDHYLKNLGKNHLKYGTEMVHFEWVGEALLGSLEHFFGENWNEQAKTNWSQFYMKIVEGMKTGMGESNAIQKINKTTHSIEIEMVSETPLAIYARDQAKMLVRLALEKELDSSFEDIARKRAREMLKKAIQNEVDEQLSTMQRKVS